MPFLIKDDKGFIEAFIDPNCGIEKFYMATEILEAEFEITYIEKNDSLDGSYWDFEFNGSRMTIHYNVFTGISLFSSKFQAATTFDNELVAMIGQKLYESLDKP